jgi:hypothetical protein
MGTGRCLPSLWIVLRALPMKLRDIQRKSSGTAEDQGVGNHGRLQFPVFDFDLDRDVDLGSPDKPGRARLQLLSLP